jgi:PAS domain S-box-containing protein
MLRRSARPTGDRVLHPRRRGAKVDRTVVVPTRDRTSPLRDFGDVLGAIDRLPIPVFAIRNDGVIRWLNMAAEQQVGNKVGVGFTQVVAPESQATVRDAFASKIVGSRDATDYEAVLLRKDGAHVHVEICSVPVDDGAGIAGVFGFAAIEEHEPRLQPRHPTLTPRQAEVLAYLARGFKTDDMAAAMGISNETVRNHVRGLLRSLDAHSRLEAVTAARLHGLI